MEALELARVNLCLGYEARMLAKNAQQRKLPVTIVSGFLGAGKTSLLHHFLANRLNLRMACAVSDLASINIDQLLLTDKKIMRYQQKLSIATNSIPIAPTKVSPLPQIYGVADRSVDAFKNVIWDVLQEEEEKPFDYLVIETSGTTDPTQLIAAVQERFGKMTRARIDSVVVVVDGDALGSSTIEELNPVAIAQLACADIVILNKIDLMNHKTKQLAHQVIRQYAPEARVYETQYGQVYLPHVLDIAPPDGIHDALSHEKVEAHWVCNKDDKVSHLRLPEHPTATGLDQSNRFDSVVYEEKGQPISLAALHQWLATELPIGTLRVKGVVWIAEDPNTRFVVQLSGKKRLEIEHSGPWISKPETQLIVIGTGFSKNFHIDLIHSSTSLNIQVSCLQRLQDDIRFDIIQVFDHVIQFRLSLITHSRALDETQLRHYHQVDRNEMLRRLIHDVNALGGGALLLPVVIKLDQTQEEMEEEWMMTAMVSQTGNANVLSMWNTLSDRTDLILNEMQVKMSSCRCGF